MQLISHAFHQGDEMPRRFTCDGASVSPPLEWQGIPATTKSLALIVEDPDAPDPARPRKTYTHWILYNIPTDTASVGESIANLDRLPKGAKMGVNDFHRPSYDAPCPSIGRHRYVHRLFALDTVLPDLGFPTRETLLKRMEGHVLSEAELIVTYERH